MSIEQHPGTLLADLLEQKAIDPVHFSERTGISYAFLDRILKGKQDINTQMSMQIEHGLGGDKPEQWSAHQKFHDVWKKQQTA